MRLSEYLLFFNHLSPFSSFVCAGLMKLFSDDDGSSSRKRKSRGGGGRGGGGGKKKRGSDKYVDDDDDDDDEEEDEDDFGVHDDSSSAQMGPGGPGPRGDLGMSSEGPSEPPSGVQTPSAMEEGD